MKRFKWIIIGLISFFLFINTSYFWSKEVGKWLIPFSLLLIIGYLSLLVIFFIQIVKAGKEKFKNRKRIYVIIGIAILLVLTVNYPKGIIDFDKLEGKDLLIATHKGGGSCSSTLKLKSTHLFKFTSVCYGIKEIRGSYRLNKDTVFFEPANNNAMYEYGIISLHDKYSYNHLYPDAIGSIQLHTNRTDSITCELYILTNNL